VQICCIQWPNRQAMVASRTKDKPTTGRSPLIRHRRSSSELHVRQYRVAYVSTSTVISALRQHCFASLTLTKQWASRAAGPARSPDFVASDFDLERVANIRARFTTQSIFAYHGLIRPYLLGDQP